MAGRKFEIRTRGEATLAEAFKAQGFAEDIAITRAVRTAEYLNWCGARVFHWTEIVISLLICAAGSAAFGVAVGLLAGAK